MVEILLGLLGAASLFAKNYDKMNQSSKFIGRKMSAKKSGDSGGLMDLAQGATSWKTVLIRACRQLSASPDLAAQIHSEIDRKKGIELLSELLDLPEPMSDPIRH